jgi:tetratricopeptide (TPR) repeat protein
VAAGDAEAALSAYEQSILALPNNPMAIIASRIKRAEIYQATERLPLAVEELTAAIDQSARTVDTSDEEIVLNVLGQLYGMRAEAYFALGQRDKADEDRRRQQELSERLSRSYQGKPLELFPPEGDVPPPAPAPDVTPPEPAPAPVVDPSA